MRKEEFLKDHCATFEEAARLGAEFLNLCKKTEALIETIAKSRVFSSIGEADVAYCVEKTGVFDLSLDDVRYFRALLQDEYYTDAQRSINYLFDEMALCKPEDRQRFYEVNVRPILEDRDRYKALIRRNFPGLVYYLD